MEEQGQLPEVAAADLGRVQEIHVREVDQAEVVLQMPNEQRLPHRFKRKVAVCLSFLAIVGVATLALHSIAEKVEHNLHHGDTFNLTATPLGASHSERHDNTAAFPGANPGVVAVAYNAAESDETTEGRFEWPPLVQPV